MAASVTVGIDIGTSSVKAIAADDDGHVVARARIPHDFSVPSPQRFQHDAQVAWHDGPRRALEELGDIDARAVSVAAMVPSLTAVDADGVPVTPGLLYGDERGRTESGANRPKCHHAIGVVTSVHATDTAAAWPSTPVSRGATRKIAQTAAKLS